MVEEEQVGRVDEALVLGPYGLERVVPGQPVRHVGAPPGENVVPDYDVVGLLDAADGGHHIGLDLLLGERVHREAHRDRDQGLHVDVLGHVRPAATRE